MALNTTQITVLHWFYTCHAKGEAANYKGSIEHFGSVLRISEPMDVIKSLMDMGLISINKTKLEVNITKEGIKLYESLRKK
jgi:hypothetical protein